MAGSKRCWIGNWACKTSCQILGHDSGACDQRDECICSEVDYNFLSEIGDWFKENMDLETMKDSLKTKYYQVKDTVQDWAGSETMRALVPSKCKIGPEFCNSACRAIGKVDGVCNSDKTDCTCSNQWVSPKQYSLCASETICVLDCQANGKATGSCRKSGGWDCECETKA